MRTLFDNLKLALGLGSSICSIEGKKLFGSLLVNSSSRFNWNPSTLIPVARGGPAPPGLRRS